MTVPKGIIEIKVTKVRLKNGNWVDIEKEMKNPAFRDEFMKAFDFNMKKILGLTSKMVTAFYKRYKMKVNCEHRIK